MLHPKNEVTYNRWVRIEKEKKFSINNVVSINV
jgi:hypothetical protein